jgi:hypothetical protein
MQDFRSVSEMVGGNTINEVLDTQAGFAIENNGTPEFTVTMAGVGQLAGKTIPVVIAESSETIGTATYNSGTCSGASTATATGVLTTDRIIWTFSADPTTVTGFGGSSTGNLTIYVYPTLNTVNFKICNNTATNITTSAGITLNFSVLR